MSTRLQAMAKRCKRRGGDCSCKGQWCEALREAEKEIRWLTGKRVELDQQIEELEHIKERLETPMATLREGFTFKPGLTPVVTYNGGDSYFGYEEDGGEWLEDDGEPWPFNEEIVWSDDCERHGIRVRME